MAKSDPNDDPFQYMALPDTDHDDDEDDDLDPDHGVDEDHDDIFADLDIHVEAFLDVFNPDLLQSLLNGHEDADENEIFPILVDPWIPDDGWEGVIVWDAVELQHESVSIFPSPQSKLGSMSSARTAREAYMKSLLNDPVLVRHAASLMRAACGLDSSGDGAPTPASDDAPAPGNGALKGLAMATAHEASGDDSLPAPDGDGFYKTPAQELTVGAPELEGVVRNCLPNNHYYIKKIRELPKSSARGIASKSRNSATGGAIKKQLKWRRE